MTDARSKAKRIVTWLGVLFGIYVALALLVYFFQAKLIFPGSMFPVRDVQPANGVEIERLALPTGESFRIAVGTPPDAPTGFVLSFVGNGEDLYSCVGWALTWRDYGLGSLVVEYPGYGESEGSPGIETILAAAEVAGDEARRRAAALGVPLVVTGSSLGSFSATHTAARMPVERMLLVAPPTTLVAAAKERFWWLPVGLLLRHKFDSLSLAPGIECPTLVIHGDRDEVVPQHLGRRLTEAFGGPAEFVDAEGYGHVIPVHVRGAFGTRIRTFLAGR